MTWEEPRRSEKGRPTTPSVNSDESVTTSSESGWNQTDGGGRRRLLNLFV
ncbi:hypothetical protein QJS10_CPA02g00304 [Acorus calamus]|uniref:Photosystem II phosphoprotein n=1 Tax=Acorus calamus TaxID=4465 RepID=A0AAV9FDR1_ACOCL|nr:hypothetical protein QJS10_CPA02g00304 [Acorus calamus]